MVDLKNLSPFKVVQMQRTDGTVITMVAKNDDFGNVVKITRSGSSSSTKVLTDFKLARDPNFIIAKGDIKRYLSERFEWTDDFKKWLRQQTPSAKFQDDMAKARQALQDGEIKLENGIGKFKGDSGEYVVVVPFHDKMKTVDIFFDADHTVAFDRIIQIDGFKQLTLAQQLEIVNRQYNMAALERSANRSKQQLSWLDWMRHRALGDVPSSIKNYMKQFDKPIYDQLEKDVQRLLHGSERDELPQISLKDLLPNKQLPAQSMQGNAISSAGSVAPPIIQGIEGATNSS